MIRGNQDARQPLLVGRLSIAEVPPVDQALRQRLRIGGRRPIEPDRERGGAARRVRADYGRGAVVDRMNIDRRLTESTERVRRPQDDRKYAGHLKRVTYRCPGGAGSVTEVPPVAQRLTFRIG
jgi:hypothetical protein